MKKLNLKQSSGSGKPQTEADSGTAEPEVDLSPILSLPASVVETGIVDQTNFVAVLEALTLVETTVTSALECISCGTARQTTAWELLTTNPAAASG